MHLQTMVLRFMFEVIPMKISNHIFPSHHVSLLILDNAYEDYSSPSTIDHDSTHRHHRCRVFFYWIEFHSAQLETEIIVC